MSNEKLKNNFNAGNAIFWFRQDMRTFDNRGLIEAIKNSSKILPIFILDKNIIPDFLGLSDKKFLFLKEALLNLDSELKKLNSKLIIFHDYPEKIIPKLCSKYNISKIFANKTYSRYGTKRDKLVSEYAESNNIEFSLSYDFFINEPSEIEQRKVFTPFYKLWQKKILEKEVTLESPDSFELISDLDSDSSSDLKNSKLASFNILKYNINEFLDNLIPGEKHPYFTIEFGKKRLASFDFENYNEYRNDLDKDGTSKLSVYLRFGIFSVREIYLKTENLSESYKSELAWREFWQHIAHYFPFTKEIEFQEKKRHIDWRDDLDGFEKWCKGETGYPVVDAAMKQLVETNYMHGRARMIVASFLTKDLLVDWRLGEAFFKKHLLDYDENVNFGNWQWSASVGADPKPLRIFNPCLQSAKFDTSAKFIFKYIPELINEPLKSIHDPIKNNLNYKKLIIDHTIAQRVAREEYKKSMAIFDEINEPNSTFIVNQNKI